MEPVILVLLLLSLSLLIIKANFTWSSELRFYEVHFQR